MKLNGLFMFVLLSFFSCKPREAVHFEEVLDQNEQGLKQILIDKTSPEEEKLNCLIKHDFKGALRAIDKQERLFEKMIKETSSLAVKDVKEGEKLKVAAMDYYGALKDLYLYDRLEIAQRELSLGKDPVQANTAQDSILNLSKKKQFLFETVYKKEQALYKVRRAFEKANGL